MILCNSATHHSSIFVWIHAQGDSKKRKTKWLHCSTEWRISSGFKLFITVWFLKLPKVGKVTWLHLKGKGFNIGLFGMAAYYYHYYNLLLCFMHKEKICDEKLLVAFFKSTCNQLSACIPHDALHMNQWQLLGKLKLYLDA